MSAEQKPCAKDEEYSQVLSAHDNVNITINFSRRILFSFRVCPFYIIFTYTI